MKRENNDVYDELGPENPYWSDLEEDEDVHDTSVNPNTEKTNTALESAKKRQADAMIESAPPSRTASASPVPSDISKRRADSSQPSKKVKREKFDPDSGVPPPPPSAKHVLKQLEKQQRRKGSRGPSASPAPQTPPSTVCPSITSSGQPVGKVDTNELTAEILIDAIKSKPEIQIREVIASLKAYLTKDENKAVFKKLLKQYAIHDKSTGLVILK